MSELKRERKYVKFELENATDDGEFSGYAAVFGNVDSGNDVIEKGAFAKTIREDFDRIKILALHNECWLPVGKPLELREDEKGLFIRGKISDTSMGRDIRTLMKDGVLNELSIGYDAVLYDYDSATDIRHLREVRLWEVSVVTWAMNGLARIDEVKSLAEALKSEAKAGKITKSKLDSLRPFIAVVRELAEILSPFLEQPDNDPGGEKQMQTTAEKETKKSNVVFEITL